MRRKPNNKMMQNSKMMPPRRRFRNDNPNNMGKIKSAAANRDKYLNLARDAQASGDRIEAENYLQHAEHYYRVLFFLQEEDARNRPELPESQEEAAEAAVQIASEEESDADERMVMAS